LTYLTNNKKRINYGKFLRKGLLIGSGAIESANMVLICKLLRWEWVSITWEPVSSLSVDT